MKTILLIEDELDISELVKALLEIYHYKVITAMDGAQGLMRFLNEAPDLIILDVMLPKLNGHEVCRKIRVDHDSRTPILMLTAQDSDTDRIIGRVRGADFYMTKPFGANELLSNVNFLLKK